MHVIHADQIFRRRPKTLAGAGAAVAVGGLLAGCGSSTSTPSTASATQAAATSSRSQGVPPGFKTPVTGAAADKAKAAATARYPGTVERVTQLPDGSYEVHVITKSAGEVHVLVSKTFRVTGTRQGGPPAGAAPPAGIGTTTTQTSYPAADKPPIAESPGRARAFARPRAMRGPASTVAGVKRIGFLSFGHWQAAPGSRTRTARDAHVQTIELAEAAEELGLDGAFVRVHHFARQLASPFPLLAAIAARTSRIEIGTAVIDMRYENPLYMAEEAAAADLISDGRLQLGISRGSPEPALNGAHAFGHVPLEGETDADLARRHTAIFREAIAGAGVARSDPAMTGFDAPLPIQPQSPGLPERIWWGSGTRRTAEWAAAQGMNLMSSTLLVEDTGVPFDELQAEQIARYRSAWAEAGWEREPRISVSRSVIPIASDVDRRLFGNGGRQTSDQLGYLEGTIARFGRSFIGEPDVVAEELSRDAAVREADTLLVTVPNQLGVAYNAHLLRTIAEHVAPAIGWQPAVRP